MKKILFILFIIPISLFGQTYGGGTGNLDAPNIDGGNASTLQDLDTTDVLNRVKDSITLQISYDNSESPEITTDATRGALSVKRGSTSDNDNVIQGQNGANDTTFYVNGYGKVGCDSLDAGDGLFNGQAVAGTDNNNVMTSNTWNYDCSLGMTQHIDLQGMSATGTITFSNDQNGGTYTLLVVQGSGTYDVDFPASWWLNGSAFDFSTLSDDARAIVVITKIFNAFYISAIEVTYVTP